MLKLALVGCLTLATVGSVQATSCIITGSIDRPCSASGNDTSVADVRAGGVRDGLWTATAAAPFEARAWTFGLSNFLPVLDCLSQPFSAIVIR